MEYDIIIIIGAHGIFLPDLYYLKEGDAVKVPTHIETNKQLDSAITVIDEVTSDFNITSMTGANVGVSYYLHDPVGFKDIITTELKDAKVDLSHGFEPPLRELLMRYSNAIHFAASVIDKADPKQAREMYMDIDRSWIPKTSHGFYEKLYKVDAIPTTETDYPGGFMVIYCPSYPSLVNIDLYTLLWLKELTVTHQINGEPGTFITRSQLFELLYAFGFRNPFIIDTSCSTLTTEESDRTIRGMRRNTITSSFIAGSRKKRNVTSP
jgi:hypothetical protein